MTITSSIVIALAVIVGFLAILVVGLLKTQAEILRKLNTLGITLDDDHSHAPIAISTKPNRNLGETKLVGVSPEGDPIVMSLDIGSDPLLVAFLSTTCSSCQEFWETIDSEELRFHGTKYRAAVVTLGPNEESPTRAASLRSGTADVVMSSEAWALFEVPGAPYFALYDPTTSSVIGEGSATDMMALNTFLSDAAGDRTWDQARGTDRSDSDREKMIDEELRRAGITPGDPRLHHDPGSEVPDGS